MPKKAKKAPKRAATKTTAKRKPGRPKKAKG